MVEFLCFRDKVNECEAVSEVSPADQVNIFGQNNEQESHVQEEREKEQAKLSKEIEALQIKLLLLQKQN